LLQLVVRCEACCSVVRLVALVVVAFDGSEAVVGSLEARLDEGGSRVVVVVVVARIDGVLEALDS
jgi:hypothetical protein